MSIEVLQEFKIRLQKEKVDKLSSTATSCFRELVEKDSLVSAINIDPITLDVTIIDVDGKELLKNQLSAGEQQMFAISIVWALALTSGYKAPVRGINHYSTRDVLKSCSDLLKSALPKEDK